MITEPATTMYETTQFRLIGWAGAILFALAPPTFLYEWWLVFYTTAVEEDPTIGPLLTISCIAMFASIPMMIVGRQKRVAAAPVPMVARLPKRLSPLRRRMPEFEPAMQPEQAI
ncbi:hypothetical protein [Aureimonas leprariae]|uniref:Uncharacterized protein n=1 Tax=Plantimonas leprariae TaxID=2615207 RepID=A0A7V7PKM6_9HYPH|nr:hypothetical protein [Aureimonas leprariae]KAB0676279.1 hypothetical protein F6X38_21475 [Aureimonas leprariae]